MANPTAEISEEEAISAEYRAPVVLDGQTLFSVRGTSSQPADKRAAYITDRIHKAAADSSVSVDSLQVVESGPYAEIKAGDRILVRVVDADAEAEKLSRTVQADLFRSRIAQAITEYRTIRSPEVLVRNGVMAAGITLGFLVLVVVLRRFFSRLESSVESRFKARLESLQHHSHQIIQAKPLYAATLSALRGLHYVIVLVGSFVWLQLALGCFPWTRPFAMRFFPLILSPLHKMGAAIVANFPNFIFLAILVLVTQYTLKLIKLYFSGLERGSITLSGFDPDWATPTFNIVRMLVISFAVVIAYPYIPGSNSDAFKGVSLFLGVVFSLGSTSVIANLIAGYSLTYRRAFKIGDRIRIDDLYGDVVDSGLVVTRVRTPKNEDVIVPNSTILNSNVMNYSTMARQKLLILHTTVSIGYDSPWRQVENLLKEAAHRTSGLLKEPAPYVLQLELGEFGVKYQINAYCDDARKGPLLYTALHQNILDLFNQSGIQIMLPAYEGDPESPKIVPKSRWHSSPPKNGKKETPA